MPREEWLEANRERLNTLKREWYQRNSKSHQTRVLARRLALRQWLREYKAQLRCERCGEDHPACLDFHHRDPEHKETIISKLVDQRGWGMERILREIAKCEVICANCHRKEHWSNQHPEDAPK